MLLCPFSISSVSVWISEFLSVDSWIMSYGCFERVCWICAVLSVLGGHENNINPFYLWALKVFATSDMSLHSLLEWFMIFSINSTTELVPRFLSGNMLIFVHQSVSGEFRKLQELWVGLLSLLFPFPPTASFWASLGWSPGVLGQSFSALCPWRWAHIQRENSCP